MQKRHRPPTKKRQSHYEEPVDKPKKKSRPKSSQEATPQKVITVEPIATVKNPIYKEETPDNLLKTMILGEVLAQPRCKTRHRRR